MGLAVKAITNPSEYFAVEVDRRVAKVLSAERSLVILRDKSLAVQTVCNVLRDERDEPTTTTTEKERDLLQAIYFDQYHVAADPVDERVWTWSPCEDFGTSAGGIMASLVKKGLAGTEGHGKDDCCWITRAGADAIANEVAKKEKANA